MVRLVMRAEVRLANRVRVTAALRRDLSWEAAGRAAPRHSQLRRPPSAALLLSETRASSRWNSGRWTAGPLDDSWGCR